ncbi:MAG: hypothetical protein MK209_07320 [Planctomycetes bacterium]|nr:hypothetical protein [Planctomycetota bacterium]
MSAIQDLNPEKRGTKVALWALAFLAAASAMVYQRATGPTYPKRGTIELDGMSYYYRLLRSQETIEKARIILPGPQEGVEATLNWRRYPLDEPYAPLPMLFYPEQEWGKGSNSSVLKKSGVGAWAADLPIQPAAGKLEYYLTVNAGGGAEDIRVPPGDETCIIRYKDPVPATVLYPHIGFMILTILFGMRAGFAAVVGSTSTRRLAWTTLFCLTAGAMVLGPFVQKYAFGHYWTGFPNGSDLTDNKSLIMWLSWLGACMVIGLKAKPKEVVTRYVVLTAAIIMTWVYSIPHSKQGSELDYTKLEEGVDPRAAVGTGEE